MKTIKIKRLFHGKASVRDYLVAEAYRDGTMKIVCGNQEMIMDREGILKGKRFDKKFKSQYSGKEYYLVDFDFIPEKQKEQTSIIF